MSTVCWPGSVVGVLVRAAEADQLAADGARGGIRVVQLQVAGPVRVHVPGEHHRVAYSGGEPAPGDPVAGGDVAVPGVHAGDRERPGVPVALSEEDLLGEQVPAGRGAPEPVEQPGLLPGTEDGPGRVESRRAGLVPVATCLVVAVLPGVEQVDGGQPPPPQPPVELHVEPARQRGPPQRHVLVVRLEGRGPPGRELRVGFLGGVTGPVVLHLVVVVVAQVQDQLRFGLGQASIAGEVSLLVLGAGGEAHRERSGSGR